MPSCTLYSRPGCAGSTVYDAALHHSSGRNTLGPSHLMAEALLQIEPCRCWFCGWGGPRETVWRGSQFLAVKSHKISLKRMQTFVRLSVHSFTLFCPCSYIMKPSSSGNDA